MQISIAYLIYDNSYTTMHSHIKISNIFGNDAAKEKKIARKSTYFSLLRPNTTSKYPEQFNSLKSFESLFFFCFLLVSCLYVYVFLIFSLVAPIFHVYFSLFAQYTLFLHHFFFVLAIWHF